MGARGVSWIPLVITVGITVRARGIDRGKSCGRSREPHGGYFHQLPWKLPRNPPMDPVGVYHGIPRDQARSRADPVGVYHGIPRHLARIPWVLWDIAGVPTGYYWIPRDLMKIPRVPARHPTEQKTEEGPAISDAIQQDPTRVSSECPRKFSRHACEFPRVLASAHEHSREFPPYVPRAPDVPQVPASSHECSRGRLRVLPRVPATACPTVGPAISRVVLGSRLTSHVFLRDATSSPARSCGSAQVLRGVPGASRLSMVWYPSGPRVSELSFGFTRDFPPGYRRKTFVFPRYGSQPTVPHIPRVPAGLQSGTNIYIYLVYI